MAEVKWIQLSIDMFNNRKIKYLRSLPEGNNIILIWVALLTIAGRCNAGGMIFLTENVPYTPDMLAMELDFEKSTVLLALEALKRLGMIQDYDDSLFITGWEEHQNIDGLAKIKEQNRIRKQRQREREAVKIECHVTSHADATPCHATDIERDIDIDKEREEEKEEDKRKRGNINYQLIADMYNNTCVSFPSLVSLSDSRKKAIKARLNIYAVEDFEKLFLKAEASDFLKGKNDRNWSATFDWLIKDANMAKVLDGNYDNKDQGPRGPGTDPGGKQQQVRDMLRDWANGGE